MGAMGQTGIKWFAVAFWCCTSAAPALAHPHVFIDAKARFLVTDQGQLTGLRITWIYDAFTSLALTEALSIDQDGDGILTESDLQRVVQAQTIWPDDFNGDTYLEVGGVPVALARPENGAAEMVDISIAVSFDLPLKEPLDPAATPELRIYDPGYYYAYSLIDVGQNGNCEVDIAAFEADEADSGLLAELARLSREETPDDAGIGRRFADVALLTCT